MNALLRACRTLILQNEGHFQGNAVFLDLAVVEDDGLIFHPGALNIFERFISALDAVFDRILKAFLRTADDFRNPCDSHVHSPTLGRASRARARPRPQ